ncbi:MAG: aminotransferase class I/II-fold pyridoxal phosphate-dependent enzyme [Acidobacteriota bacterium]
MRKEITRLGRRQFLRWASSAGAVAGAAPFILAHPPGSLTGHSGTEPARQSNHGSEVVPATAGDTGSGVIRLNANENPYGPSPAARRAIEQAITESNRYPIAEEVELIGVLAKKHDLSRDQVLPGCGSTELLRVAVAALASPGRLILAEPTYEDPIWYSRAFDIKAVKVPLDDQGAHDLPAMERAAEKDASLVYVCNPNNPTGVLADGKKLEAFVRRASKRATVLVDEAYHDYITDPRYASMVPLVAEGLPVVVTRTFSKIYGMAGLRLGYALSDKKTIERMAEHITFSGANMLAIHAGLAGLGDRAFVKHCRKENGRAREDLQHALTERGYPVFQSQTNFVMFKLGSDVRELIADLKEEGIRIGRPFPPLTDHCRISLGTPEQMERFVEAFDRWRRAAAA